MSREQFTLKTPEWEKMLREDDLHDMVCSAVFARWASVVDTHLGLECSKWTCAELESCFSFIVTILPIAKERSQQCVDDLKLG